MLTSGPPRSKTAADAACTRGKKKRKVVLKAEVRMPHILAWNPGSNSLKFDLVAVDPAQRSAADGRKLLSGSVDNIGKETKLTLLRDGKAGSDHAGDFGDFAAAVKSALATLREQDDSALKSLELHAVRVVHGGSHFHEAVRVDDRVRGEILRRRDLAPLHNPNSAAILDVLRKEQPDIPAMAAFDTAFHQTLPEHAGRYPVERGLADKHGLRRYGFHGLSHRYMLERYAQLVGRVPEEVSAVTFHLESGSSACAIERGRSVDTSMGLTPLEGLMMGTRSGSLDPAALPFLCREAGLTLEQVMELLEKKSGLLGVSGVSLDTRELRERDDPASRLALKMFGYRARLFAGAYLAALGEAETVILGGGIGENTPEVRAEICDGLRGWGLLLNERLNEQTSDGDVRISAEGSRLAAWVIHVEEGLQLAFECARAAA